MLAAEWGTGQVFWSMMWFFLFFIWIWLLISIFSDIFRSNDLSGWGKAAWTIFVIVLPFIGIFTYLIVRGRKMTEHARDAAYARDEMLRGYTNNITTTDVSGVDQLSKLASLHAAGAITDSEYETMKSRVVTAV
jgi:hypothetical protein